MIHRPLFAVAWNLGRYCNYSCSYCWPHAHSTTKTFRRLAELSQTVDAIKEHASKLGLDWLHFSFSGGEPTLHPDFLNLLTYIVESPVSAKSIHVTSNLSQGTRWWTRFCLSLASLSNASITASWHPEAGAKDITGHRTRFAEKVSFLQSRGLHCEINLIMVPENFDVLVTDADYFQSRGLRATLKPLTVDEGRMIADYTEPQRALLRDRHSYRAQPRLDGATTCSLAAAEINLPATGHFELTDDTGRKWYLNHAEDLNVFEFNRFRGWYCEAGFRSVVIIEPSGEMKRGYGCFERPLGTAPKGFSLLTSPTACVTRSCLCSADSKIPKWRSLPRSSK